MRARSAAGLVGKRQRDVARDLVAPPADDVEHDHVEEPAPRVEDGQRRARQGFSRKRNGAIRLRRDVPGRRRPSPTAAARRSATGARARPCRRCRRRRGTPGRRPPCDPRTGTRYRGAAWPRRDAGGRPCDALLHQRDARVELAGAHVGEADIDERNAAARRGVAALALCGELLLVVDHLLRRRVAQTLLRIRVGARAERAGSESLVGDPLRLGRKRRRPWRAAPSPCRKRCRRAFRWRAAGARRRARCVGEPRLASRRGEWRPPSTPCFG